MKMQLIFWNLQLAMIISFLVFSFIPLLSLIFSVLFSQLSVNLTMNLVYVCLIILFTVLGLIALFGITTLNLGYRSFVTIFFSCGILFYYENPYLLALGITLAWSFYNIWFITFKYRQLDQDYSTYPSNSIERQKLLKTFQIQFSSFALLTWIILSVSWGILLIASNFYIELGTREFGTLGITISLGIILIIYLFRKSVDSSSRKPLS